MARKILFKDAAGNTISSKFIKSRNTIQVTVRNRQGRIINPADTKKILKKHKFRLKIRGINLKGAKFI